MTTVHGISRAGLFALVLAALTLTFTATAGAQAGPPSSVHQYVEMIPTAEGPNAPGTGAPGYGESGDPRTPDPAGPRTQGSDREQPVSTALESAGALATASVSDARLGGLLVAVLLTTLCAAALAVGRSRSKIRT